MFKKSHVSIGNNRANRRRIRRFAWFAAAFVLLISFIVIIPPEQEEISRIVAVPEAREVR